jgi:hypothetical protein
MDRMLSALRVTVVPGVIVVGAAIEEGFREIIMLG